MKNDDIFNSNNDELQNENQFLRYELETIKQKYQNQNQII